ncbi:hypothetical protein [Streptomyces katrae]|uniref:Uncharacterized protein n=1 Tax=Streptomyces katrae TaxID=68223 RepID=A0A0F4IUP7_9ACTN|nr:hypothetical protein [Streptomyces katrae]KJY25364.1 hypothetical protein VR44_32685 [Streptomyces katrae]
MARDETWTSEEYGRSHEGRVAVLLADGTTPKPVYFDGNSSIGETVRHWSVYDGSDYPQRPRAHALRAECTCGWTGESHTVDWEAAGDLRFREHGDRTAGQCLDDWDKHTIAVGETTVPLPADLLALLEGVTAAIERLGEDSPVAAVKAARELEIIASRTAHWPAHEARAQAPEKVAAALGLNIDETRALLARFGGWNRYQ